MPDSKDFSPNAKRLNELAGLIEFRKRNEYVDLPNENYTRSPLLSIIQTIAKIQFMIGFFGLLWGVIFYFYNTGNVTLFATFFLVLCFILAAVFILMVTGKLSNDTFYFVTAFWLLGLSFWFIQVQY